MAFSMFMKKIYAQKTEVSIETYFIYTVGDIHESILIAKEITHSCIYQSNHFTINTIGKI